MDHLRAAFGKLAQFGRVVAVLGTEDPRGLQKFAVEAERVKKVSGIVRQPRSFGYWQGTLQGRGPVSGSRRGGVSKTAHFIEWNLFR
jgi:hypothetical protein